MLPYLIKQPEFGWLREWKKDNIEEGFLSSDSGPSEEEDDSDDYQIQYGLSL